MDTQQPSNSKRRVVVIGAGIAGIFAARVLSDLFDEVTLIERDRLSDSPDPRAGVPQDRHFHSFLTAGSRLMERLLEPVNPQERELLAHLKQTTVLYDFFITEQGFAGLVPSDSIEVDDRVLVLATSPMPFCARPEGTCRVV